MEKEDARKQSREVLQERRKQVIRLHRKGVGVMQIVEQTGLSRVREAINLAIDRDALKRAVMRGQSIPSGIIAPAFVNGYE